MNAIATGFRSLQSGWQRFDRVWLGLALGILLLLIVVPTQGLTSAKFVFGNFIEVLPFLAFAVAIAAYAKASGADTLIAEVFKGRELRMIVVAALFGALSPFCSCGVIPIIASLLSMGVPLPAIMAFWLSSPIMDPQMFLITAGQLGLDFAVAKTLAAIGFGLFGGGATWVMMRLGGFTDPLKPGAISGCGTSSCGTPSFGNTEIQWQPWRSPERRGVLITESSNTMLFLGKWLAFAFLIESLMIAYVPAEAIASALGGDNFFAIPLAVIIGVPAYMNGFAAIPLVSGLLDMGMSPGAALAFMTAGGVSCIPAAIAVYALVRPTVFGWYIALAAVGALLSGLIFQFYTSF